MLPSSIHHLSLLFFLTSSISALNTVNIPPNVSLPTNSSYNYTNASCNSLLTHANATASRSFRSPLLGGFSGNGSSPSDAFLLTAAVNEVVNNATNSTGIDTTIWFGMPPDRNLPQDGLSYAACAIIIDELPLDSIKRGQADNGSCEQTFSESCNQALINRLAEITIDMANDAVPGQNGNWTTSMYPDICENIASQLSDKDGVPNECKKFRDEGSEKLWFNYETERMFSSINLSSHASNIWYVTLICSPVCSDHRLRLRSCLPDLQRGRRPCSIHPIPALQQTHRDRQPRERLCQCHSSRDPGLHPPDAARQ